MDGADKAKKKDIVEKLSDFAERNPNVQKAAKNKSPFAPKRVKSNKNLLSKSVVISENEASAARLEEIRRYQQQIGINAEIDAKKQKAIKTTITVLISLIFAALFFAIIWLVVETVLITRQPIEPKEVADTTPTGITEVEGYKCKTNLCEKLTDLPDGKIILRDTAYYIYNPKDKEIKKTTIDESYKYRDSSVFYWGDNLMIILYPPTGKAALFSITDNHGVTDFKFDSFITDINDTAYADMKWVAGKYIIAKGNKLFYLINIKEEKEVINADKAVFIHDKYTFAFEKKGNIRAHTLDGKKIVSKNSKNDFYLHDGYLFIIPRAEKEGDSRTDFTAYDDTGKKLEDDNPYIENLRQTVFDNSENYAETIVHLKNTYIVPRF